MNTRPRTPIWLSLLRGFLIGELLTLAWFALEPFTAR